MFWIRNKKDRFNVYYYTSTGYKYYILEDATYKAVSNYIEEEKAYGEGRRYDYKIELIKTKQVSIKSFLK